MALTNKWADYLVSKVRYKDTDTKERISHLKVHADEGEKVGPATTWARQDVITKIENRYTFCTIYKSDSKWNKGADIHIIELDGTKFLRTDANRTKKDNLGNLPEF